MAGASRSPSADGGDASEDRGFTVEPDAVFNADDRSLFERAGDALRGDGGRDRSRGKSAGKSGGKSGKSQTVREAAPAKPKPQVSSRDIGADIRDAYLAASKSAQRAFGSLHPQLAEAWELDKTEITLLSSPTTRLIKQTSDVAGKANSPWFTGAFLAGMAALIIGPRLFYTRQVVKALQLAAEQGGAVQAAEHELRANAARAQAAGMRPGPQPAPHSAPMNGYGPPDPLANIVIDRE